MRLATEHRCGCTDCACGCPAGGYLNGCSVGEARELADAFTEALVADTKEAQLAALKGARWALQRLIGALMIEMDDEMGDKADDKEVV